VWIDIPNEPSFKKANEARINVAPRGSARAQLKPLEEFIPVDRWVETYKTHLYQSFIFGPQDPVKRLKIADASCEILSKRFGIQFKSSARPLDILKTKT
jgi:hypothetical protein